MRTLILITAISVLAAAPRSLRAEGQNLKWVGGNGLAPGEVIHFGHDYVVSEECEEGPSLPKRTEAAADAPWQVVFLNFDGEKLKKGGNDSQTNTTNLILVPTLDYPAADLSKIGGTDKGKKAIVDTLKLIYMEYAVKFVTTRPTDGSSYTMSMIGGTGVNCAKGGAGTVGVSPLDCKNSNKNDLNVIYSDLVNTTAKKISLVIAHELGHSFGLEHVTDTKGIMYPSLSADTCCWVSAGLSGSSSCGRTSQDSKKVLKDNLGVGKQDKISPLVWIVRPGAGAILPPNFSYEVTAGDDLGVRHVVIYMDGAKQATFIDPPFTEVLKGVSDGEHTIKVEGFDWISNKSTAEVKFTVDSKCVLDGTCVHGKVGIGNECIEGSDCITGICAVKSGVGKCVDKCSSTKDQQICPDGLTCQQVNDSWACVPGSGFSLNVSGGGGGGCNTAGTRGLPAALSVLIALFGLGLLRRRA